ncbi:MAG: hypothetical protein IPK44_22770 [Candidatus Accumulibacter sp.]|uniref:hypothetical protein n=1 Tax=Accumulibacter sp. TaxID=2053492 RepID=UPI002586E123|nr:hypothetical protein [Accumulibacter sp.]MBK8117123.1 hypothetical protein [Accumulibacter sp.]
MAEKTDSTTQNLFVRLQSILDGVCYMVEQELEFDSGFATLVLANDLPNHEGQHHAGNQDHSLAQKIAVPPRPPRPIRVPRGLTDHLNPISPHKAWYKFDVSRQSRNKQEKVVVAAQEEAHPKC